MGHSKHLPSVYTIRGLRTFQGLVFLDKHSAQQYLNHAIPGDLPEHVTIEPAEVIYYGGSLGGASTEDLQHLKLTSKE